MDRKPTFFSTPVAFRAWLQKNHRKAAELLVGYYRKDSGKPSITWPESVAEALCFGWIDGVRGKHSDEAYTIRFTPRRTTSRWSAINIRLIGELEAAGKMTDAGRAIFAARRDPHLPGYSVSKREGKLDDRRLKAFKKYKNAWTFFEAQPPGYRKLMYWWVMQAKQDETRDRRLEKLIEHCVKGKRIR